MEELARDYLIFVFLACLGALQAAGAFGGLRGLLLFQSRRVARAGGVLLAVGAFIWFFTSGDRNLSDTNGGIAGAQQFVYFVAGCAAAVAVTFLFSSLLNVSRCRRPTPPAPGFEALRESTVLQTLWKNLTWSRRQWLNWMRKSFSG